jgi:ABC-type dipeptide/oligopeptide/nickel transport system permease component
MNLLLAVIVGIPVGWHLAMVAGTYWDAGRVGMSRPKWTAMVLFVPLFGFFAYLFERTERSESEEGEDPYADSVYNVHETHREDEGSKP